jgi:RNA polymerase sigma-70 factor (ECF subfamily)
VIRAIEYEKPASKARSEFDKVAMVHMDSVYRAALWMTRNQHEAEDLVQETYLRAFRSFHRFEQATNCRAWLLRILTNLNIDRYTRAAAKSEKVRYEDIKHLAAAGRGAEGAEGGSGAGSAFDYGEFLDEDVKRAVESVPETFRAPLLLSAVEGLSYKEIARALGCPMGTVMSRVYRGRQLLKRKLAGYARAHRYQEAGA